MQTQQRYLYIVLSDTGSLLSRIIRLYTNRKRNHVSIAFDEALHDVYSFGRKCPNNLFISGFTQEDLRGPLFQRAQFNVYRCAVSERQYDQARAVVERFVKDERRYKYHFLGLLGVALNKPVERRHAYFCSQFVAHVLREAGVELIPKHPALTTPADFERSDALELTDSLTGARLGKKAAGFGLLGGLAYADPI